MLSILKLNLFKYTPKNGLNFGDELGPLLIKEILKKNKITNKYTSKKIFSIGSVIHFSRPGDVVWGSGINGKVSFPDNEISNDFRAVRGPLSQDLLEKKGYKVPKVFGDPAILINDFFTFKKSDYSKDKILIIPNYNDFNYINIQLNNIVSENKYLLVHPFTNYEILISMIQSCKAIVTSSLHGLLFSDLYEIPNSLLLGKNYAEDQFKYIDYSQSIGKKFIYHESLKDGLEKLSDPTIIPKSLKENLLLAFPSEVFE